MPEKDGSDDKKSTKSVVNKKQKQLMNKEQLDLTSVAESFGGKIVGEPVELDEFVQSGHPVVGAAVAGQKVGKWLDKLITPRLNPLPKYAPFTPPKYEKKDGVIQLYTNDEIKKKRKELETKNKEKENKVIKLDMVDPNFKPDEKEIKKISPPKTEPKTDTPKVDKPKTDTQPAKEIDKETKFDPKNIGQGNDKKNTTIVKPTDKAGSETNNQTKFLPLPLLNKTRTRTRTRTKTGTKGGIPKLPRMPGTVHNVGRRVNPQ